MPALTINTNSFVQQYSAPPDGCVDAVGLCLPVYATTDIAFQFIHPRGIAVATYQVGLIKDGVEVGNKVSTVGKIQVSRPDIDPTFEVTVGFVNSINGTDFENVIEPGQCFKIRVYATSFFGEVVLFDTNCFIRIEDSCYTSLLSYRCDENSFGFYYYIDEDGENALEGIYNRVRLPFHLTAPQFPTTRKVFVKSDGKRKKLSSRIATEYEANTDYMPKDWHEKLVIALEHDEVLITNIDSGFTEQGFSQEGPYDIDWQKFINYPTAPAKFKLLKTPYYNVNTNC